MEPASGRDQDDGKEDSSASQEEGKQQQQQPPQQARPRPQSRDRPVSGGTVDAILARAGLEDDPNVLLYIAESTIETESTNASRSFVRRLRQRAQAYGDGDRGGDGKDGSGSKSKVVDDPYITIRRLLQVIEELTDRAQSLPRGATPPMPPSTGPTREQQENPRSPKHAAAVAAAAAPTGAANAAPDSHMSDELRTLRREVESLRVENANMFAVMESNQAFKEQLATERAACQALREQVQLLEEQLEDLRSKQEMSDKAADLSSTELEEDVFRLIQHNAANLAAMRGDIQSLQQQEQHAQFSPPGS